MSFTGNEDHHISLDEASILTRNFRMSHPGDLDIKGFFFGKTAIQEILNQPDCVGIRIYFGEDATNEPRLVIVGANANENDLDGGRIAEFGMPCPPRNSVSNPLNS